MGTLLFTSCQEIPMTNPPDRICRKCSGNMKLSIALAQTLIGGMPDFIGDTHSSTFSAGGPGKMVECMKCEECGWSVTVGKDDE